MNPISPSYLASKDRIEASMRYLEGMGLPMHEVWKVHTKHLASFDSESPDDFDRRYELPVDAPTIGEHFLNGEAQVLSPGHLWAGYSYTLTPGQRAWLREQYGMTPTATVTVLEIARWPGTRHPRVLHLKSDLHVDPRQRRHILTSAVIRTPGKFFAEAAQYDAEREAQLAAEDAEKVAKGEATGKKPRVRKIVDAADYLDELAKALG